MTGRLDPGFVSVRDVSTDKIRQLPTEPEDNTLGLKTLVASFPDASNLEFEIETGVTRALR